MSKLNPGSDHLQFFLVIMTHLLFLFLMTIYLTDKTFLKITPSKLCKSKGPPTNFISLPFLKSDGNRDRYVYAVRPLFPYLIEFQENT